MIGIELSYTGAEIDALLAKAETLDTDALVPAGGTTGQVLTKSAATDYATAWTPAPPAIAFAIVFGA